MISVLDELYGLTTDIGSLPPDAALHQPEVARAFLRKMARRFGAKQVDDGTLEPGDLIVTAIEGAGPTHVVLALEGFYFADCIRSTGVRFGGACLDGLVYHATYRLPNKQSWSR